MTSATVKGGGKNTQGDTIWALSPVSQCTEQQVITWTAKAEVKISALPMGVYWKQYVHGHLQAI